MASGFAVTLPYGLSEMHRQHHIKGKVVIGREGEYTRGGLPISTHSSKPNIVLPIITYHRAIDAPRPNPTGSHKVHVRKLRQDKMAVAVPTRQKKKTAPTPKERRQRTPKVANVSKPRVGSKAKATPAIQKSKSRVGPGTRDGASKHRPITIDDDDEADEAPRGMTDFMQGGYTPSSTAPSSPSIYQSQSPALAVRRGSAPGGAGFGSFGKTHAATSPKAPYDPRFRSMSIYAELVELSRSVD